MTEKKEEPMQGQRCIEEWKEIHKIKGTLFAGMKAEQGWKPGKKVSEKEFLKAYEDFCRGPADGRKGAKG